MDKITYSKSQSTTTYEDSKNNPVGNYMFKGDNRNTRTRCEIRSKLTIKAPE